MTAGKPKAVTVRKTKADTNKKIDEGSAENAEGTTVRPTPEKKAAGTEARPEPDKEAEATPVKKSNPRSGRKSVSKQEKSGSRKKSVSKKQPEAAAKPAESGDKLFSLIGGMIPYEGSMWLGNATELAERIRMTDPSVSLAPMQLSRRLNLMKEKLEAEGIFYESGRNSAGRYLTLTRKPKQKAVRKPRKKASETAVKEKRNAS